MLQCTMAGTTGCSSDIVGTRFDLHSANIIVQWVQCCVQQLVLTACIARCIVGQWARAGMVAGNGLLWLALVCISTCKGLSCSVWWLVLQWAICCIIGQWFSGQWMLLQVVCRIQQLLLCGRGCSAQGNGVQSDVQQLVMLRAMARNVVSYGW